MKVEEKIIKEATNNLIEYKPILDINPELKFGLEIEFAHAKLKNVDLDVFVSELNWEVEMDGSVTTITSAIKKGGEVVSPILKNDFLTYIELEMILDILKNNKAKARGKCGGHIHIDRAFLKNDLERMKLFFKFFSIYEPIIYRFAYGENCGLRDAGIAFAAPSRNRIKTIFDFIDDNPGIRYQDMIKIMGSCKTNGLNFPLENDKTTVEFRKIGRASCRERV